MTRQRPAPFSEQQFSRRGAVRAGGLGAAAFVGGITLSRASAQDATPVAMATAADEVAQDGLAVEVLAAFDPLPGTKALKFWAPPDAGRPAWSASFQPDQQLVIASAFKCFVLAEYLRQAEAALDPTDPTPIASQLNAKLGEELDLDERFYTLGSSIFNPPNLAGKVTARTVLEAMVIASDNTAADMALQHIGPAQVRELVASMGLVQTRIPDSTRQFIGYVFGDPDWQSITWEQLLPLVENAPYPPRLALNDVITMASSAENLVDFYARALQGEIFRYPETLAVFRAILSLADVIALIMPLGINAFLKGGSLDAFSDHVLSVAGGVYVAKRWVYFAMILNWDDAEAGTVASVVPAFATAANTMLTLVQDRLGAY